MFFLLLVACYLLFELVLWLTCHDRVRFVASEAWRKEFGTNDLATDFEYTEKAEMFKFYPQYYHKTDKVGAAPSLIASSVLSTYFPRMAVPSTSNSSVRST